MLPCLFLQGHLLCSGQVCMSYRFHRHVVRDLCSRFLWTQLLQSVNAQSSPPRHPSFPCIDPHSYYFQSALAIATSVTRVHLVPVLASPLHSLPTRPPSATA